MLTPNDIAGMLDHSMLKPEMDTQTVRRGCEIAREYTTASVCVRPCDLKLAAEVLQGSKVKLSTVIGFPHGSNATRVKVFEAQCAMDDGAQELDMVLNIGFLLSDRDEEVQADIAAVVNAAHARGALVKVIFENAYLDEAHIRKACRLATAAGADFVKTSTGFAPTGATLEDVMLMRRECPAQVRVKAAGGVRSLDAVLQFRAAGCARCGATATQAIMEEAFARFKATETVEKQL